MCCRCLFDCDCSKTNLFRKEQYQFDIDATHLASNNKFRYKTLDLFLKQMENH